MGEHLHCPLLVTLLQLMTETTEVIIAFTRRTQDGIYRWRRRFEWYLELEVVVDEAEVKDYVAKGWVDTGKDPVSIHRLKLHGPPPIDEDFDSIFESLAPND